MRSRNSGTTGSARAAPEVATIAPPADPTASVINSLLDIASRADVADKAKFRAVLGPCQAYTLFFDPPAVAVHIALLVNFYRALQEHIPRLPPQAVSSHHAAIRALWQLTIDAVPAATRAAFERKHARLSGAERATIAVLPDPTASPTLVCPSLAFLRLLYKMFGYPPLAHQLTHVDFVAVSGSLQGCVQMMRLYNELAGADIFTPYDAICAFVAHHNPQSPEIRSALMLLAERNPSQRPPPVASAAAAADPNAAWRNVEEFADTYGDIVQYWVLPQVTPAAPKPSVHAVSTADTVSKTAPACKFCRAAGAPDAHHFYKNCTFLAGVRAQRGLTSTPPKGSCLACGSAEHPVARCPAVLTSSSSSSSASTSLAMNTSTSNKYSAAAPQTATTLSSSHARSVGALHAATPTAPARRSMALSTDASVALAGASPSRRLCVMLDTGATVAAVDAATARSLGATFCSSPSLVNGPGGTQFHASGVASLDVTIGSMTQRVEALVVPDLGYALLLGTRELFGTPGRELESRGCGSPEEVELRFGSSGPYTRARFAVRTDRPQSDDGVHVGALDDTASHEALVMLVNVGGTARLAVLDGLSLVDDAGDIPFAPAALDALESLSLTPAVDVDGQRTCLSACINALAAPTLDDPEPLSAGESGASATSNNGLPTGVPDFARVHISPGVPDDVVVDVATLLRSHAHVFGGSGRAPPVSNCPPFRLRLLPDADVTRLRARDRPFGPQAEAAIAQQIKDWTPDIVEPSNAPFSSRPLAVRKKDGTWRICVDYRRVNLACHLAQYPLPRSDDVLSRLASRGTLFSKFDGWAMFNTLPIDDELTRDLTSFKANGRLYRFRRCPFGLSSLPSHLQRFVDTVYGDHPLFACYADDISLAHTSTDKGALLADLTEFLKRTDTARITVKATKCFLLYRQLEVLGHQLSARRIAPPHDRLDGLLALSRPERASDLRRFLHATQQLAPHLPLFSRHAAPLYTLANSSQTTPIDWSAHTAARAGLEAILQALRSPTILAPFDATRTVILRTDFSQSAISFVILQPDDDGRERIVYCNGARLEPYASAWSPQLGELVALRHAVRRCPQYLTNLNKPFIWISDNKPLTDTVSSPPDRPSTNAMIERILVELSAVPYVARHVAGTAQPQALQDYISRLADIPASRRPPAAAGDQPSAGAHHTAADTTLWQRLLCLPRFSSSSDPAGAVLRWLRGLPADSRALAAFGTTPSSPRMPTLAPLSTPPAPPSSPRGLPGAPAAASLPATPPQLAGGGLPVPAPGHSPDPLASMDAPLRHDAWRASLRSASDGLTRRLVAAADADARSPTPQPTAFWDGQRLLRVPRDADRSAALAAGVSVDRTQCLVYVPPDRRLEIFAAYHHGDFGGHYGAETTRRLIMTTFVWRGITADVAQWCGECQRCVVSRHHSPHGGSGLPDEHARTAASAKFRCVALDLFELTPSADGARYVLIAVDMCTRWTACAPLRDKTAASTSAAFLRCWLLVYGVPWVVLSDNGNEFAGPEWQQLARSYGFSRSFSAPYNPQGNSVAERDVQEVKNRLARVVEESDGSDWPQHLPRALAAVNNVIGSRGYSAFELCFGQQMLTPAAARLAVDSFVIRGPPAEVVTATAERAAQLVVLANTRRAELQLNDAARRRARAPVEPLAVGDVVGLNTRDNDATKFARLARAWPGPFVIIAKAPFSTDSFGAFQLSRPDGSLVSEKYIPARQLVRWHGDPWSASPPAIAAEPGAQPWRGINDSSLLDGSLSQRATDAAARHAEAEDHSADIVARLVAANARMEADFDAARARVQQTHAADAADEALSDATERAITAALDHNVPLPVRGIRVFDSMPASPVVSILDVRFHSTLQHQLAIVTLANGSRALVRRDAFPSDSPFSSRLTRARRSR